MTTTMLRTTSRKAQENVREYVLAIFDPSDYPDDGTCKFYDKISKLGGRDIYTGRDVDMFSVAAHAIYYTFWVEKINNHKGQFSEYGEFLDWCSGLPSILKTEDYYLGQSAEVLARFLETGPEVIEKAYPDSMDREQRISGMIYNQISKAVH